MEAEMTSGQQLLFQMMKDSVQNMPVGTGAEQELVFSSTDAANKRQRNLEAREEAARAAMVERFATIKDECGAWLQVFDELDAHRKRRRIQDATLEKFEALEESLVVAIAAQLDMRSFLAMAFTCTVWRSILIRKQMIEQLLAAWEKKYAVDLFLCFHALGVVNDNETKTKSFMRIIGHAASIVYAHTQKGLYNVHVFLQEEVSKTHKPEISIDDHPKRGIVNMQYGFSYKRVYYRETIISPMICKINNYSPELSRHNMYIYTNTRCIFIKKYDERDGTFNFIDLYDYTRKTPKITLATENCIFPCFIYTYGEIIVFVFIRKIFFIIYKNQSSIVHTIETTDIFDKKKGSFISNGTIFEITKLCIDHSSLKCSINLLTFEVLETSISNHEIFILSKSYTVINGKITNLNVNIPIPRTVMFDIKESFYNACLENKAIFFHPLVTITPTTDYERFRYRGLHVCLKKNNIPFDPKKICKMRKHTCPYGTEQQKKITTDPEKTMEFDTRCSYMVTDRVIITDRNDYYLNPIEKHFIYYRECLAAFREFFKPVLPPTLTQ